MPRREWGQGLPSGAPGMHLSEAFLLPAAAEKRHFWEDESLCPELVAPVAIKSCGPTAALASSGVPDSGPVCVSQGLGTRPAFLAT